MKIIVGLGNPGERYSKTRHNIGYRIVEEFAKKNGISFRKRRELEAELGEGISGRQKYVLLKPHTFMNLSGQAVRKVLDWYKASVLDLLIVQDDIDLELGKLRLRDKGRSGGHNGIQSILDQLGVDTFQRLKIGVGRPPAAMDPAAYVLAKFTPEEEHQIKGSIVLAVERIEDFLRKG